MPSQAGASDNYLVYRRTDAPLIPCEPKTLSMQVYGDGSGNFLNVWVDDAAGARWQFTFGHVWHTGWRNMVASLESGLGWPNVLVSGPSSTQVALPLRLFALVVDGAENQAYEGVIYVDQLMVGGTPAPPPPAPPPPAPTPRLTCGGEQSFLNPGESTTIFWTSSNATAVYLDDSQVDLNGSMSVSPSSTRNYNFRAVNAAGRLPAPQRWK